VEQLNFPFVEKYSERNRVRFMPAGLQCLSSIFLKFGRMCSFTSTYAMCNSLAQFSVASEKILSYKVNLMTMLCMQKRKKRNKMSFLPRKVLTLNKRKVTCCSLFPLRGRIQLSIHPIQFVPIKWGLYGRYLRICCVILI